MPDVLWSDVSEFQVPVNDSYPFPVLCIRADDGTYRDHKFPVNYAWAKQALASGKLKALLVYTVYRQNWRETLATYKSMVGDPPSRMAAMIDLESWGGQIVGDQSDSLNAFYAGLITWLGDPARVVAYGNTGDLNSLWPRRPPGLRIIVAAYGSNPAFPGKLGHQFTDGQTRDRLNVPPFGFADVNSADGYDVDTFCTAIGLSGDARPERSGRKRGRDTMIDLPATSATDLDSDPAKWPQRNHDVGFDAAGGWEGQAAVSFGAQDWHGGGTPAGFLRLASWILPGRVLVPVDPAFASTGNGQSVEAHAQLGPWVAPPRAVGITLNYAAPGQAYIAVGRSA